jgi:hypothetical protein
MPATTISTISRRAEIFLPASASTLVFIDSTAPPVMDAGDFRIEARIVRSPSNREFFPKYAEIAAFPRAALDEIHGASLHSKLAPAKRATIYAREDCWRIRIRLCNAG